MKFYNIGYVLLGAIYSLTCFDKISNMFKKCQAIYLAIMSFMSFMLCIRK